MRKLKALAITIIVMIIVVAVWGAFKPDLIPTFNLVLLAGLIGVTTVYAYSATIQANANTKMAEEMRKERIWASRPLIVQKAQQKMAVEWTIITDYFSHFEICNAGKGPAVELEIFVLNEQRRPIFLEDEITYLRPDEAPLKLLPVEFEKEQTLPHIEPPAKMVPIHLTVRQNCTYLVSQYRSVSSYGRHSTWYQTWLPFRSHRVKGEKEIRLEPGKPRFEEVSEKERIVMPLAKEEPK